MLSADSNNPDRLGDGDVDDMYRLFIRYYTHVTRQQFVDDLRSKDTVIMLRDQREKIKGFSTLSVGEFDLDQGPVRVVFSGDTVIDRKHWGSQVFAAAWIRQIGHIAAQAPNLKHYWLLIVKGHRTYRYLPTFAHKFVPDWRCPARTDLDETKDIIAAAMFGKCYDADNSIVRFEESRGQLAPDLAEPSRREAQREDVKFFLQSNPGYVNGDELVCLCEIDAMNMKPFARRIFEQTAAC